MNPPHFGHMFEDGALPFDQLFRQPLKPGKGSTNQRLELGARTVLPPFKDVFHTFLVGIPDCESGKGNLGKFSEFL